MPNSNATTTTNPAQGVPNSNGINSNAQQIPINHQYASTAGADIPQGYHTQQGYGSPSGGAGGRQQQQQFSPHFQQGFGFDPDIDDMFGDSDLRSHMDRMRSPFGTFGSRKRSGNKNPLHSVSSSYYDDDDADFPQFGSLGRRRPGADTGDDFFERIPSELRKFIPESFTLRRGGSGSGATANAATSAGGPESPRVHTQQPQYFQTYVQPGTPPQPQGTGTFKTTPVQMRTVCDAAIQTEDPSSANNQSEVDGNVGVDNLHQHGLRNTVDMGVKAPFEGEGLNDRAQSAPPYQQEQNYMHEVPIQQQQPVFHTQGTGTRRTTPPPAQQQRQFPPNQQPPQFQKAYYPPPNQPQQQPTTPQTPGGSYIRTIPIFVEGRSEPLINNRDIPQPTEVPQTQAYAQAKASQAYSPQSQQQPQQQQHNQNRPSPINTQQQPTTQQEQGPPPATPHTMDSINKIQDIQRDVLNLMSQVEKFAGARKDKEYAYLDEMLTRNLLKLDTIDTQGKESIRLARKEAIKCIQASINVLEAKAEENAKTAKSQESVIDDAESNQIGEEPNEDEQQIDVLKANEPIPLPPPESLKTGGSSENVPAAKEASPPKDNSSAATTTTNVTKSGSGSSAKDESVAEAKTE